jgi:hypothetical protein
VSPYLQAGEQKPDLELGRVREAIFFPNDPPQMDYVTPLYIYQLVTVRKSVLNGYGNCPRPIVID